MKENIRTTVIEWIAVLVWMASTIIFYEVLAQSFPELDFLQGQAYIHIIASYFVSDGLIYSLLYRNLVDFGEKIGNRGFSSHLLLPTKVLRFLTFRNIQFSSMTQIPIAIVVLLILGNFEVLQFGFWVVSIVLGFIIATNLWQIFSSLNFFFKLGDKPSTLFEELTVANMFPLRLFLTSKLFYIFLPFVVIGSGAGEILNGRLGLKFIFIQILVVLFVYILKTFIYRLGVRQYRR